jgi:hypothetical protein
MIQLYSDIASKWKWREWFLHYYEYLYYTTWQFAFFVVMRLTEILEIKHSFQSQYKFKFFIKKESSIRNVHVLKNAQMTRTNKRIKQGNTRKIKKIITILQLYQRESYPNICRLYINNTLIYIYIYKHESALLVIEHKYIHLLI